MDNGILLEGFKLGLFFGLLGYSWIHYLTNPREILAGFWGWVLSRKVFSGKAAAKVLTCEKCLAGQFALWFTPLFWLGITPYSVRGHFVSIVVAIFIAGTLNKLLRQK